MKCSVAALPALREQESRMVGGWQGMGSYKEEENYNTRWKEEP